MSAQAGDWGEMVLPGVYMIQRSPGAGRAQNIVSADGQVNFELVHLEMEELTKDIERLTKSNEEIVYYLSHKEEYRNGEMDECDEGDGDDGSMAVMLATNTNTVEEEEEDDEVFREALIENEGVIHRKEAELAVLRALLGEQKCGCHAHSHAEPPGTEPTEAEETRRTTGGQEEDEDAPADRIIL